MKGIAIQHLEAEIIAYFNLPSKWMNRQKKPLDFINKKLNKYNISCEEPKRIIVLSDVNASYSFDKNAAISVCKEKNNKFDCVSINDQRI